MIITEYNLDTDKIAKNYRIALISDYHNANYKEILDLLPLDIDLILIPGDFVVRYLKGKRTSVVEFLRSLYKIAPCYCSMGNHEFKTMNKKAFCNMILDGGAYPLLNNSIVWKDLCISGWYYNKNQSILHKLGDKNHYNILLSHKPEWYAKYIKDMPFDLVLSGHAHGGQIRILGQGIYSPGQGLFPKYTHGILDNRLIISAGVSNPVHMPRWGNPKEIVIINLKNIHSRGEI